MKESIFNNLVENLRDVFITREVFDLRINPIEKIVYGATGLVLVSVLTAIIYLVIQK